MSTTAGVPMQMTELQSKLAAALAAAVVVLVTLLL
jgi:hypothetical protein